MGRYSGEKCRLIFMLGLNAGFFLVEISVGYITNSMALVADSFHMLSDVAALLVALLSVKMSSKKWSKNTFGWARAEVLGALVNAVFLAAMCFFLSVEALKRFLKLEDIREPKLVVIVGSLGLVINIVGLLLFYQHGGAHHGHSNGPVVSSSSRLTNLVSVTATDDNENDEMFERNKLKPEVASLDGSHNHNAPQMNMQGVYLHILADALGSIIVVISASIVWLTDWKYRLYMDPALSILMVIIILKSLWPLLRDSSLILLQAVPTHIEIDRIQKKLLDKVDGVLAVHEFHIWQLAGERIIASAHIRCENLSEYMKIAEKVKEFFHNEGIHSTTIQPEFSEVDISENPSSERPSGDCVLDCPKTDKPCTFSTCCGPSKQEKETHSPGDSPYMCRQRNCSTLSLPAPSSRGELSEMERGSLLDSGRPHISHPPVFDN